MKTVGTAPAPENRFAWVARCSTNMFSSDEEMVTSVPPSFSQTASALFQSIWLPWAQ